MSNATLKPLKRSSLAETVAGQLRRGIIEGDFSPGSALSEPALAERLGVSRAPVREALIALEREGLVCFDDRGRTRVRALEPHDFEEICTLRVALESLAGRRACRSWNAELAAALTANLARQSTARTIGELSHLDGEFHELIVRAADHQRLLAAWLVLRPQLEMWLTHTFEQQMSLDREPREMTLQSHRQLFEALASGDEDRSAALSAEHVDAWRYLQPHYFSK
ncbi:GntR family transcriptional regulator [Planctomicrobium piriforme]|uniref:DNA-binding transcriptional regulator, GntR family n=1 Tax=Planctomicrobium piriforme TaxID=1576369 RepID=A0A1I3CGI4_9PLAN|nr:GntR family transcriptional regulator [Planctomicrobium piriforme]SFH73319.1 DNA-binding transcriptional regulator, GntR family [Planctomicrobium piriforme]